MGELRALRRYSASRHVYSSGLLLKTIETNSVLAELGRVVNSMSKQLSTVGCGSICVRVGSGIVFDAEEVCSGVSIRSFVHG
jgi:hypothetical protein